MIYDHNARVWWGTLCGAAKTMIYKSILAKRALKSAGVLTTVHTCSYQAVIGTMLHVMLVSSTERHQLGLFLGIPIMLPASYTGRTKLLNLMPASPLFPTQK